MASDTVLTPLMRQYFDIKNQFPDALVLFQVGDFYELFFNDAHKAASFLGIVLTQRGTMSDEPIPLCGVPRHTVEHYLIKLVKGGFRVVICDQLEAPQPGKIVERGVTQVFTPGTLVDTKLLDSKSSHYIAALISNNGSIGLIFYEMLAGSLYFTEFPYDEKKLDAELAVFTPREILLEQNSSGKQLEQFCKQRSFVTTYTQEQLVQDDFTQWLQTISRISHQESSLTPVAKNILQLLGGYIKKNAPHSWQAQKNLLIYQAQDYLQLDAATQKNLEIINNTHDGSARYTLFEVVDEAVTGMGSRLLKKWLMRPLIDRASLEKRLEKVTYFVKNSFERNLIRTHLKKIGDLERTLGRMFLRRATYNDYRILMEGIVDIPALQKFVSCNMQELTRLFTLLTHAINIDQHHDWKIAAGYHSELDRLRSLSTQGMQAIFELERKEQQKSGINTLKIRYSQAAGYAIEVSKAQSEAVPTRYIKIQSLTNRDRFTTQELKDLEYDINRAENSSTELENQLFTLLMHEVENYLPLLRTLSQELAELDVFSCLAHVAVQNQWVYPEFTEKEQMIIIDGRHPIVERRMLAQELAQETKVSFVPNNTKLTFQEKTWIITGPNMGGKSTYLRQVALIQILAQIGSFVPAKQAILPLLDRIFTRIGAGDHLAQGKSTFLVEMEETALICGAATHKSLVILDEVGRGTSTYDGLALAQAIVEYLHQEIKPFCLFATHYHELTALANTVSGIACYHAASKAVGDTVVLLHNILPGIAPGSFGIQVAKAAHLPKIVIDRARILLAEYAQTQGQAVPLNNSLEPQESCKINKLHLLDELDLDTVSPRQAYEILCKLKEL
ncbi:MAG: DNA mismatch repair protein MutS [Candidatus Babeliaceae bacterium]|nr:DNA mismatch repair protein MutS [Candidatus Babeliaceae bacterium]